jgi:transposase
MANDGKAVFKVSAAYTSQECADCEHIQPENRQTQSLFVCQRCGHTDNADANAAKVIKKRAIKALLDSGTELSERGVLIPIRHRTLSQHKTENKGSNCDQAIGYDASKKMFREALSCAA